MTHPALLKAVIDKLETLEPKRIIVGDSVGTESYGNSQHIFDATGLTAAAGPYYRNLSLNLKMVDVERPVQTPGRRAQRRPGCRCLHLAARR